MHVKQLLDLSGRVAIVTGGSSGLGLQMAEGLMEAGAKVTIAARRKERLDNAAAKLAEAGGEVLAVACDCGTAEGAETLVGKTMEAYGRVDILVNNAGVTWGAPALDFPLEKWDQLIRTNVTGYFLCSKIAGKIMMAQGKGKIINIGSVMGVAGGDPVFMDSIAYNASKGAVLAFTKDLAVKWAPYGINVNGLAPGWYPTHMTGTTLKGAGDTIVSRIPLNRYGGEDDLKGAVVFLSSDASDYVCGHMLYVDGGYVAW